MLNTLKRLRVASETGQCVSEMIAPELANKVFTDALFDKTTDTILFGSWFITIFQGKFRKLVKFSSLKIRHLKLDREKAERFSEIYGIEGSFEKINTLGEGKNIFLSVARKFSHKDIFSKPKEWLHVFTEQCESFNVSAFRNSNTDNIEVVIHKFNKGE